MEKVLQQIQTALPGLLKQTGQRTAIEFHALIEENFDDGLSARDAKAFVDRRGKTRLGTRTGRLTRSFLPNQQDSTQSVQETNGVVTIRVGTKTPYAAIHENGGFIASKGRMHKFFWFKYMESQNPAYKYMALAAQHKGGIKIPARPFFKPALKNLEQRFPVIAAELFRNIKRIWDSA